MAGKLRILYLAFLILLAPIVALGQRGIWGQSPPFNAGLIPAGSGAGTYRASGVLFSTTAIGATNGNTADTNEDTLGTCTYTMPANTMSAANSAVRVTFLGNTAATADVKATKVYFGATVITARAATADNAQVYQASYTVWRTGATTQVGDGLFWVGGVQAGSGALMTPAETLSGAVVIKVTGQDSTGANANAIMCKAFTVELLSP